MTVPTAEDPAAAALQTAGQESQAAGPKEAPAPDAAIGTDGPPPAGPDDGPAGTGRAASPLAGLSLPLPPLLARSALWRVLTLLAAGVALAVLLYYPVGAWRAHKIDDAIDFAPQGVTAGQSEAVAAAAQLVRREIDGHAWAANKPFFMPAAILVSMPAYQTGMTAMIGHFVSAMAYRIGRPEGGLDPDLARAAELMSYPPDVWMIDPKAPWSKTFSTEKQYRNAARSLEAYNLRLAAGTAGFDHGPQALSATLEVIARDLEEASARLDGPVAAAGGWFAHGIGALYYSGKGRAYAALMLVRALGEDDRATLAAKGLEPPWQAAIASLTAAAEPRPWVVLAGGPASAVVPNHLAIQGYHLQRAAARLLQLSEALR
ncbi:MAG: DUF2333 family protein [Telmatospirillum sp.]|nr:DUF2333 family protein [Telmatospirillum sp.]